jgi:hypothetical protein
VDAQQWGREHPHSCSLAVVLPLSSTLVRGSLVYHKMLKYFSPTPKPRGSPPPLKPTLLGLWVPGPGTGFRFGLADGAKSLRQPPKSATAASVPYPVLPLSLLSLPSKDPSNHSSRPRFQSPYGWIWVGGHWGMGMRGCAHSGLSQTPVWSCPQDARLSTARPASATTSAPSVRKACTCTRAAAIQPVLRAPLRPTAPWSAAVLVSSWVLQAEGPRL